MDAHQQTDISPGEWRVYWIKEGWKREGRGVQGVGGRERKEREKREGISRSRSRFDCQSIQSHPPCLIILAKPARPNVT